MKKDMSSYLALIVLVVSICFSLTTAAASLPIFATTDENNSDDNSDPDQEDSNSGGGGEGGGDVEDNTNVDDDEAGVGGEGGSVDDDDGVPPAAHTDEPIVPLLPPSTELPPQTLTPTEKEDSTVTCSDGVTEVVDMKDCPHLPPAVTTESSLPEECGDLTALECLGQKLGEPDCGDMTPLECLQDKLNNGDTTVPPTDKPNPYCDKVKDDPNYHGACHDRKDYSDVTGLYPCNDGTNEVDWRDCEDATDPNGSHSPNCKPEGKYDCDHPRHNKDKGDDRDHNDDFHKKIINNIDIHTTVNNGDDFPDVDIIGLSIKDNGAAAVCMMNINHGWIECQNFGVSNDRINDDIWRIIEVNSNEDFDDGDTGNDDVDDAIDAVKQQDFSELNDLDNHDFNVDLASLGINSNGDGLICLIEDSSDEGSALCESFSVSSDAINKQITETTEING